MSARKSRTAKSTKELERRQVVAEVTPRVLSPAETTTVVQDVEATYWEVQHVQLDYDIRVEKKDRRKKWDRTLLTLVVCGFFGSYLIIVLIGVEVLYFGNNAFAVPSVVAAGILGTYGLAKIAAEYFFSEDADRRNK
ncbi:MAG TPA: hypothetical protein VJ836_02720 [Candidatus Saccharimonadales bacterium]|nr:hypothetical protein [Candidatus Saccharimonadales bacterium]